MKINITLLLQVGNFCLTYYVLNKYILKQTVSSLDQRRSEEESLNKTLKSEKEMLLLREKEKDANLLNFQKRIKEQYVAPEKKPLEFKHEVVYKRDAKYIENLTEEIKEIIVKEVPRVR